MRDVDVVLDLVGGERSIGSLGSLRDGGLLISSGMSAELAGLTRTDLEWLDCMITGRVPLDRFG